MAINLDPTPRLRRRLLPVGLSLRMQVNDAVDVPTLQGSH